MSLDAVIAVYIIPMAKLPTTSSFAKSLRLTSSLIYLITIKVIILCNTKSPIRLKASLAILGNLFTD